jgi:hypothetical protein
MRAALFVVLLTGLAGCVLNRNGEEPPPGTPSPGQWTPQQGPSSSAPPTPPTQAQPWSPQPQPAWSTQGAAPAPQAAPAQPSFPWPAGWMPQLPPAIAWPATPIALPAGWPGIPGLPGWPGQAPTQPAPTQPQPPPAQPAPALPGLPLPGFQVPGQPAPPLASGNDVAQRCVDDINGYRATKGLAPLARWNDGEGCAANESATDSRSQTPHGSFGTCREMAQNACPNWPGPAERMIDDCLRMMWNEGPGEGSAHGHYENMVSPRSRSVACGFHTMPDGRIWAIQNFR